MTRSTTYLAAKPGDLYWRYEPCPIASAKVLLLTVDGVCTIGPWYGAPGEHFQAWCPLPKKGVPPPEIRTASLWARVVFALKLIFSPQKLK